MNQIYITMGRNNFWRNFSGLSLNFWPFGAIYNKSQLWYNVLLWYIYLLNVSSKEKLVILQRKDQYIMKLWPLSFRLDSTFQGWLKVGWLKPSQSTQWSLVRSFVRGSTDQKDQAWASKIGPVFFFSTLSFLNLTDYPVPIIRTCF